METAALAGDSIEADFIVVQSDTDLATLATVGLGNVNIPLPNVSKELDGLAVSYAAGTATIGLDIDNGLTATGAPLPGPGDIEIPYLDTTSTENHKATLESLMTAANAATSYAATIADTLTITHGLATKDVIVQLYDTVTNETVYADVLRVNTTPYNTVTITFAATPTNSVRVLVQKIG